jgi:hypothetical protein
VLMGVGVELLWQYGVLRRVVEENGCGEIGKRNTKYQQTEKTKDFDILTIFSGVRQREVNRILRSTSTIQDQSLVTEIK